MPKEISRRLLFFILALLQPMNAWPERARADTERPNGLSIEVLGRTIIYGYQFDREIGPNWLVGIGLSRVGAQEDTTVLGHTLLVPVFFDFHFKNLNLKTETLRPYLTGGLTIIPGVEEVKNRTAVLGSLLGTVRFSSIPVMPNFGAGFEVRQEDGFLFRLQGLALIASSIVPTAGFSLGYAF